MKSPIINDQIFSESYLDAKGKFLKLAEMTGAAIEKLDISTEDSGHDCKMEIDIASYGKPNAEKMLLITCGLHGIEGYCGSALALNVMNLLKDNNLEDVSVVIVHGINPYGMLNMRRVNEHNIDLNRNFIPDDYLIPEPSKYYWSVDSLLNRAAPPRRFDFFFLKLIYLIIKIGYSGLKDSVAGGQFYNPHGLFYGGEKIESSSRILVDYLQKRTFHAKIIVIMDLHSGIGRYKRSSLICHSNEGEELHELEKIFKTKMKAGHVGEKKHFKITGSFLELLRENLAKGNNKLILPVTFEFGTASPLTVLSTMRNENMLHHFGKVNGKSAARIKDHFKECFYPRDKSWRNGYVNAATKHVLQAFYYLKEKSER